ncbi:hypothetical protein [Methanonatronarchaeum sp. AMET6-2]|uniref:hypothetical protein n=1 Tax=Methanonatronarchaeum sp. AMET6-2 TaxID=2933293 RepID=UPI001225261B|nr:hypothetical protein [Methanonatronarchaeum sp. AMET6-2]RZN60461.1 MAG: hypothetical protein EF811_06510 [Methanonatronarchaeia archaeon]UOY09933.1 hypothetical protein MU439_06645 [Methanonatronarchaeum sp. AMET6-2]
MKKKFLAFLVVLAMVFSVAAVTGCMDNNEFNTPEDTVEAYFEAMNNEDAELLSQAFAFSEELGLEENPEMIFEGEENNIEYELIEINEIEEVPEEELEQFKMFMEQQGMDMTGMEMKIVNLTVSITEDGQELEEDVYLELVEEDGEYNIFPPIM